MAPIGESVLVPARDFPEGWLPQSVLIKKKKERERDGVQVQVVDKETRKRTDNRGMSTGQVLLNTEETI